jgi:hypothetical protein
MKDMEKENKKIVVKCEYINNERHSKGLHDNKSASNTVCRTETE